MRVTVGTGTRRLGEVHSGLVHGADEPIENGNVVMGVRGALCCVDADWPLIGGDFLIRDVAVVWPKKLFKLLTPPGPSSPITSPLCGGNSPRPPRE